MASIADILKRPDQKETVVKHVHIDGQVVLKIKQHCDGALPQLATGQLLGLDVGQTLEVTDCFPFPVSGPRAPRRRTVGSAPGAAAASSTLPCPGTTLPA
jgi:hypothetical protein